jgi:peptide/nickel transport system substrate-binding protein
MAHLEKLWYKSKLAHYMCHVECNLFSKIPLGGKMLKATRFLLIGVTAALIGAFVIPAFAQDVTPGQGGILIEGNFGGDVQTLNPFFISDTASSRVAGFIWPGLVAVDPDTATFRQNDPTALAESWTISDDGLVYTFTLKQNWTWSDGTPITARDIQYSWDALVSGALDETSRYVSLQEQIASVESPDDYTLVVTYNFADCTAISNAATIPVVPSHVFPADYAELTPDWEFNLAPTVTGGLMTFGALNPGEQVALVSSQSFGGAPEGVLLAGYIYKNVPDQRVLVEQFVAGGEGNPNVIDGPAVSARADLIADPNVQPYQFPGNAWDYLALNYADPANAQARFAEDDSEIDQGHHPLFGDLRVRKAISHAINVDEMIEAALFGFGDRMNAFSVQASWAYPQDLPMIEFNQEMASDMLTEAGFVDDDNDPATPRVAQGAMYAADGTPFVFTLLTNQGNARRETVATLIQAQLALVGVQVDVQAIEFNTVLEAMDNQNFDAVLLGWRNGYPDDPDQLNLFGGTADTIGGNNMVSYYNPRFDELSRAAAAVPGCATEDRIPLYAEIQTLLQDELPYIPLYTIQGFYGSNVGVSGFDPRPSNLFWNVDTWAVRAQ